MDLSRQNNFLNQFGTLKDEDYSKKITIVGCGGSGSPLAELLVRGGFRNISLVDFDVIEKSNIQRQLFLPSQIGLFKAQEIKKRLELINPDITCVAIVDQLNQDNIDKYLKDCEFIFDAVDNFETRFSINEYSKKKRIDWMYLGAIKSEVICALIKGENSGFENIISKNAKDEDCSIGVLGSTTFIGASISYTEFLKYLVLREKYEPKLIKFNIWNNKYFEVKL